MKSFVPVHYNQWIHLKSNEIIRAYSLQLMNSLKIQWNPLAYRDIICCTEINVQSWLKNELQYGMNGWLLKVELQCGMAAC
jgi:hypothetical protein